MFLSIIIPIYNCGEYLEDCLDSCLNQNIPSDDYEIICINDGSTDNSGEVLKRYLLSYGNIKVYTQDNKGVSTARNVGLDHAQGEYIMFVDGDDLIAFNVLSKLKDFLNSQSCGILTFEAFIGSSDLVEDFKTQRVKPNNISWHFIDLLWLNIYDRSIIEDHSIRFIEGITHSEDVLFLNDIKNWCQDSVTVPLTVYFYRTHSGSAVDRKNLNSLNRMVISYIKIIELCKNRMYDDLYNKELNYNFWSTHMAYLMRYIPEMPYLNRKNALYHLKSVNPCLPIKNAQKVDKYIKKQIRRSNALRRIEIIVYANAFGAHLIVIRRKISDSRFGKIVKHPKRFAKNPVGFLKSL